MLTKGVFICKRAKPGKRGGSVARTIYSLRLYMIVFIPLKGWFPLRIIANFPKSHVVTLQYYDRREKL